MKKVALLIITVAILGTGCTKKPNPSERFLNFGNSAEPEFLDPALHQGVVESRITVALFDGLTHYHPKDGSPVPALAAHWEISPDQKTYTFHLRRDAKWSDGRPVTAHDFVWSWTRMLDPKTATAYAFALFYIKNGQNFNAGKLTDPSQLGLKALDDHTFQVTLEYPAPYFLEMLWHSSHQAVPRWAIEKHGDAWTRPENIVTNGPFLLKEWVPHKEIVVVKNPNYYDAEKVKLPGIRFYPMESSETGLKMYEAGELDLLIEVPVMKIPVLIKKEDTQIDPQFGNYFWLVNVTKPPLNDARVRRALSLAIDRKTLCEKFFYGTQIPSTSYVPPGLRNYAPVESLEFNPEKGRALLKEAGYADPKSLPKITLKYNTDDRHKLTSQVIQQMWKEHLGIEVNILGEEWKSFIKTKRVGDFQISRHGWVGDYPDPNTFLELWTTNSSYNDARWSNPRYDDLIQKAANELDRAKRAGYFQEAEKLLLEEAVVIPYYVMSRIYLKKPSVKGYYPNLLDVHPFQGIYLSHED